MPDSFTGVEYAERYVARLISILQSLDCDAVARVVAVLAEARNRESTVFFMGNGGSAATACHFANDLSVTASPEGGPRFRAVSLASNVSLITCLANDFGYETIFSRQLENLMRPGDVVIGISASGNSPNVVQGLEYAERHGGISVAIVGFDGGIMKRIAEHVIHVVTEKGQYGPVEDVHMVLDHLISTCLRDSGR